MKHHPVLGKIDEEGMNWGNRPTRTAHWLGRVLAAILVASASAGRDPQPRPFSIETLVEPPAGSYYHGVFPGSRDGMGGDVTLHDVRIYQRAVGKSLAWVYFWNNWYENPRFPFQTASWIRSNGSVPYIRMMLLSGPSIPTPDPVYSLKNIIEGKFDPLLRNWMQDARKFGSPVIAEYGVEVDGWWFPWNGLYNKEGGSYVDSVARFREAYRHIIRIAREEGAYNIRWVFHVDPWDEPIVDWNKFENYYPGDEWIDWVGASVYGRQLPSDPEGESFRAQMDWVYGRMQRLTHKPFVVCEFGTINDANQSAWTTAALSDLLSGRWPKVIGFSWWNTTFENDRVSGRRSNMQVQENPTLQAIFRKYVGENQAVISHPITRFVTPDER
jgi:hypothetical protein